MITDHVVVLIARRLEDCHVCINIYFWCNIACLFGHVRRFTSLHLPNKALKLVDLMALGNPRQADYNSSL